MHPPHDHHGLRAGRIWLTAAALGTTVAGCYGADFDPLLPGVFACDPADEAACPETMACINQRCERADDAPVLSINGPEDEESFTTPIPDGPLMMPAPPFVQTLVIQGTLDLVSQSSGAEHVFGEGHVAVFVDGEEQMIIDAGAISSPTSFEVEVPNKPGPHRIALQARRNDGVDYTNEGAHATRLFWLQNEITEGMVPMVAIKSPWPGDEFPLDDQEITVELAVRNFQLAPTGDTQVIGEGHAHIYYDQTFPECVDDVEGCDKLYTGVVNESGRTTMTLPASAEQAATLTAVLRHIDHDPQGFPNGCNPAEADLCAVIFDEIEILRVD